MDKNKNVISIKKNREHFNVGLLIFGVVFVYLLVTVIMFFSTEKTSVYEVREGSILKDTSYSGIVLREETVVNADKNGYVNYFFESGKKVPLGANAYLLTKDAVLEDTNVETNEEVTLKTENWNSILFKVQNFNENYNPCDFKQSKALKDEINSILLSNTTKNRLNQLNSLITEQDMSSNIYTTLDDGIICYSMDGYESLKPENITQKEISKQDYKKVSLMNNTQVKTGEPVYRLITSNEWFLVIGLDSEMEKQFVEQMGEKQSMYVQLRVVKDNQTVGGRMTILHDRDKNAYGCIKLADSMIRYAEDRYLDVEMVLENKSGLKIPKSAVTEKEFYVVSDQFLTNGGASSSSGVLRKNKKKANAEYIEDCVFYRDLDKGLVYLKKDKFQDGDVLLMPESTNTVTLNQTETLSGVYNVNRGYAVFTKIDILCESADYVIIKKNTTKGLNNYDHIALDGKSVVEHQIISQ